MERTLIGLGGQFIVYGDVDGRVLKRPNTLEEAIEKHMEWAGTREEAAASARQGLFFRDVNVPRVLRLAARYDNLATLLAHPAPGPQGQFTQDEVTPLGEKLGVVDGAARLDLIERYLQCVQGCWRFGIYDYMCLFDCNYGLTAAGTVAFIDFGELSSFTPFVRGLVADAQWKVKFEHFPALQHLIPDDLRSGFKALHEEGYNVEVFDREWGAGLDDLDRELLGPEPLRDHPQDIPALVDRIAARCCAELERAPCSFSDAAMEQLVAFPWGPPDGLEPVVHDSVRQTPGDTVGPENLAMPPEWPG